MSTRKIMSVLAASAALVAALSVPALAGTDDLATAAPVSLPILGDDDEDDKDKGDHDGDNGKDDDGKDDDGKDDHDKSGHKDDHDKGGHDKGGHDKSDKKQAPKPETVEGDLPVTH